MPLIPLSPQNRRSVADHLRTVAGIKDPLPFLEQRVFADRPDHLSRIPTFLGRSMSDFYVDVVRYCERSGWSHLPPLLENLLRSMHPDYDYSEWIERLHRDGPFHCHPGDQPYEMCLVAADLPLLNRNLLRAAAMLFDDDWGGHLMDGSRPTVLRVYSSVPERMGKTHTREFFRYLEAIQPMKLGVVHIDFKDPELLASSLQEGEWIERTIVRRLSDQVRSRRNELIAAARHVGGGSVLDVAALLAQRPEETYSFSRWDKDQQRPRWVKDLADALVDRVIARPGTMPGWWVVVFDHCEAAPVESQELVRRLVDRAVSSRDTPLRIVLLGDSGSLLPDPVDSNRIIVEDLAEHRLDHRDVVEHLRGFATCKKMPLSEDQAGKLADKILDRAIALHGNGDAWERALSTAVLERTIQLERRIAEPSGEEG